MPAASPIAARAGTITRQANSLGTTASIDAITRRDIVEYFSSRFNAANLTVIVATDLETAILKKILEKYFTLRIPARSLGAAPGIRGCLAASRFRSGPGAALRLENW